MNYHTLAPKIDSQSEQKDAGQPAFCPYYRSGELLRAKHQAQI